MDSIPIRRPRWERSRRRGGLFGDKALWFFLTLLIAGAMQLHSEEGPDTHDELVVKNSPKEAVAQEIVFEGLASYGHYKIFASGEDCKMYTAGVEYDRHSWGRMFKARVDYVAEFLPVVLLWQPDVTDIWGNSFTSAHHMVPGVGISPIGARWLWRDGKGLKPYLMAKGGLLIFTSKPISSQSTYENFSLQSSAGLQIRLNPRVDLRLGLFGDLHFSNAFIVPVNPGLDVMNASVGISYHLGGPAGR